MVNYLLLFNIYIFQYHLQRVLIVSFNEFNYIQITPTILYRDTKALYNNKIHSNKNKQQKNKTKLFAVKRKKIGKYI